MASFGEDYRTWTARNGKTIEALLIYKSKKELELRDRKGKIHKVDPSKLSDEDQLYLFPPPPPPMKYKLGYRKSSKLKGVVRDEKAETTCSRYIWDFSLNIEFLTDDAFVDGLVGAVFLYGKDAAGANVVIAKTEAPLGADGKISVESFELTETDNEEHELMEGVSYSGFYVLLLSADGEVLAEESSRSFVADYDKAFSLKVGDRFNKKLEVIDAKEE
jgi:hypothetical protein